MNAKRLPPLQLAKRVAIPGLVIGSTAAALGIYESGLIMKHLLAVGIGINAASMMIFGFGLCLSLMEDKKTVPRVPRGTGIRFDNASIEQSVIHPEGHDPNRAGYNDYGAEDQEHRINHL